MAKFYIIISKSKKLHHKRIHQKKMYVTRPLSLYRKQPAYLSSPPPEGPNSGYLILCDEEAETTTCFGLCKNNWIKNLPFPQNKDLNTVFVVNTGQSAATYSDDVLFIPVLDQPLSSNRYYVILRKGKHQGEAYVNSTEEDKATFCCCSCIKDVKPRPLDPLDDYQQVEIIQKNRSGFTAKSVASDGFAPEFLRRKYWNVHMKKPKYHQLQEASGLDSALRARLPDFDLSISDQISKAVVVGNWYTPFMFVKEQTNLKYQIMTSMFYEITLEQRWDKIFSCQNIESENKMVSVDVYVEKEEVFVDGKKAIWDGNDVGSKMVWFKSCENSVGKGSRIGLSMLIVDRMKWEEERIGWMDEENKKVRVERLEKFEGNGLWSKFGCYVLVESFVFKRKDGSIALAYDFKHLHQIRCKWE